MVHLAVVPSPSLSNSIVTFDERRIADVECVVPQLMSGNNLTFQNETDILGGLNIIFLTNNHRHYHSSCSVRS